MEEQFNPQEIRCSKCGKVLYQSQESKPIDEIIKTYNGKCPNCGKILSLPITTEEEVKPVTMNKSEPSYEKPSAIWYLLPVFLTWIGGIIGYFLLKDRDIKFAKRLLIIGIIWTVLPIVIILIIASIFLFGIIRI